MRDERLAVHLLTGFLGSGKTTLLNALLGAEALADTAVIVNEFGDIAIDHLLVERSDDRLIELAGGCLCCAVRGDLASTLLELEERRREGDCQDFSRVVIETTGLADPVPVLNLFATDAGLGERFRLGQVVTTVDALNGASTIAAHPVAARQVALADRLVVTKPDLVGAGVGETEAEVLARRINPQARLIRAVSGRSNLAGVGAGEQDPLPGALFEAAPSPAKVLEDLEPAHGAGVDTFTVRRTAPIPAPALALFVEVLAQHLGSTLLRVKGLVDLVESPGRPAVLQGAQHVFHPLDFLAEWPDNDPATRLVFIGEGLHQPWIEALLDALIEEVRSLASEH